jgi:mono/diheme cytochrome c family protein
MRGLLGGITAAGIAILSLVPVASAAGDAAAGKELYVLFCTRCHGKNGRGDGPSGALLATKPSNLADCARMQATSDQELVTVIQEGGPALRLSKDMPRLGNTLEDHEIADLITYIRSFCQP